MRGQTKYGSQRPHERQRCKTRDPAWRKPGAHVWSQAQRGLWQFFLPHPVDPPSAGETVRVAVEVMGLGAPDMGGRGWRKAGAERARAGVGGWALPVGSGGACLHTQGHDSEEWPPRSEPRTKDFRVTPKLFWKTVWHLRRGKRGTIRAVYSKDWTLLTSTEEVIGRWKEYFCDLLNPTQPPSVAETELEDDDHHRYPWVKSLR